MAIKNPARHKSHLHIARPHRIGSANPTPSGFKITRKTGFSATVIGYPIRLEKSRFRDEKRSNEIKAARSRFVVELGGSNTVIALQINGCAVPFCVRFWRYPDGASARELYADKPAI